MLITFDLEGTLVEGELFPELGRRLGYERDMNALTKGVISGDLPYEETLELRASLIRGESLRKIRNAADSLPLIPGARETIRILKIMGLTPAIITGGFDILALRAAVQLGIENVYCNHFAEKEGKITGVLGPIITPQAKADILINLAKKYDMPRDHCIAVGDGANDIPMLKAAGLSIAFNASNVVRKAAKISVENQNIGVIIPYIMQYLAHNESERSY